eukprot:TRINITY_DN122_c0_g4_i1.p1 TRINITY_DN122_c0_g4~~TRINITY_DN122_c0_g4_i1.p1  ORF type:complete len:154 (+),score=17.01 TRINITY_DN122_c0_g4_i1:99-560(+)
MESILQLFEVPFHFLRVPIVRLKTPTFPSFSPMLVFCFVFLTYFLVLSGIIYDVIIEPPSIGSSRDEATGSVKPIVFMKYRLNGQFIIEGLSAGMLFSIGGLGVIILHRSSQKLQSEKVRYLLILAGVLCVMVSYNLCILFLRNKIPGYQKSF